MISAVVFFFPSLRLNLSAAASDKTSPASSSGAKKRRRADVGQPLEEFSQQSSSSGFTRSATSTCGIDISEVDVDGKFIKLTNTTDKVYFSKLHFMPWHVLAIETIPSTTVDQMNQFLPLIYLVELVLYLRSWRCAHWYKNNFFQALF